MNWIELAFVVSLLAAGGAVLLVMAGQGRAAGCVAAIALLMFVKAIAVWQLLIWFEQSPILTGIGLVILAIMLIPLLLIFALVWLIRALASLLLGRGATDVFVGTLVAEGVLTLLRRRPRRY